MVEGAPDIPLFVYRRGAAPRPLPPLRPPPHRPADPCGEAPPAARALHRPLPARRDGGRFPDAKVRARGLRGRHGSPLRRALRLGPRRHVRASFPGRDHGELRGLEEHHGGLPARPLQPRRHAPGHLLRGRDAGVHRRHGGPAFRPRLHLATGAAALRPAREADGGPGWVVTTTAGEARRYDQVVLTVPAEAAALVEPVAPEAAARLVHLRYNRLAMVHLVGDECDLHGLGYQVGYGEKLRTRGVTWNASALGRAGVYTAFLGGARDPDMLERPTTPSARWPAREFEAVTGCRYPGRVGDAHPGALVGPELGGPRGARTSPGAPPLHELRVSGGDSRATGTSPRPSSPRCSPRRRGPARPPRGAASSGSRSRRRGGSGTGRSGARRGSGPVPRPLPGLASPPPGRAADRAACPVRNGSMRSARTFG
jgi:hypothetical protein